MSKKGKKYKGYLCECQCGKRKIVNASDYNSGKIKSCGCLITEFNKTKKGNEYAKLRKIVLESPKNKSPHYERIKRIWKNMKNRCGNPNATSYEIYGGRGITVCEEWENSFMSFYEWALNNGYEETLSIDRIDNDKGYCPYNCRWATAKEQRANQRRK